MKKISLRPRTWLILGVVALIGAAVAWRMLPPHPLNFAGGRTVALSNYSGPTPTGVPEELRTADLVTRGKYLTEAADCEVCHTAEGGQPFAGGRAFETPFGALYSPNLTADRDTGIGAWSDAEFVRAVHQGIGKDGERLYPAFPYESYTLLVDEDVLAIKAYLFSLPAVHTTVPPNTLKFPYNQRWLMAFWSAFYNPDERFQPNEARSPEWNRGAYLAEALAHCGDCHTPRNLAQALDNRRKFAGTVIDGWRAYNITSDAVAGLGNWSDAELIDYLGSGHASGHGSAGGPMAEVVDFSLSKLAPTDMRALVVYLRSIPAIRDGDLPERKTSAAPDAFSSVAIATERSGRQVFEGACAACHGWSGVSPLTGYATLTGSRGINDPDATNVVQVILSGQHRRTANGVVFMPAFGDSYSDSEIAAVANYVTARFGAAPAQLTAEDVAEMR